MKALVLLLLICIRLTAADDIGSQKIADRAQWQWDDRLASAFGSIDHCGNKYAIHLESHPTAIGRILTIHVALEGREIYRWIGHPYSAFAIDGDKLFFADFSPSIQGGVIVAVDLTTGAKLWSESLKGHYPVAHSAYRNRLIVEVHDQAVLVWGKESIGTYLEIKDSATGKTVGHRIFEFVKK